MKTAVLGLLLSFLGMSGGCLKATDNCATISTYAFCKLKGIKVSASGVRAALNQSQDTSFAEIQSFLRQVNCPALILQCTDSDVYGLKPPLIAYITISYGKNNFGHYLTIVATDPQKRVRVIDPMLSQDAPVWLAQDDFNRVFKGYVLVEGK